MAVKLENKIIAAILKNQIIAAYDEADEHFADWANQTIEEYFAKLPKSRSPNDPRRLGSRSVFISRLRGALMEKAGPIEFEGQDEFNKMSVKEQLKFQAQSRVTGKDKWVHSLDVMPTNIQGIKMSAKDALALQNMRNSVDTGKLRVEMEEVDGDRLLAKLCPHLEDENCKRHELAAALLIATGRRTAEVLMTGTFYLRKDHTSDGYLCMFSGQTKQGLFDKGDYEIPLLVPFHLVRSGMARLRELYPTADMTTQNINESYAKSIGNYTQKAVGLTPHNLRACYALMTYKLSGEKKMSLVGWIGKVLGHAQTTAAAYYQRLDVTVSGPWKATRAMEQEPVLEEEEPQQQSDWVLNGAVELKRLAGLQEMMDKRIKITATSIRTNAGGTMNVIQRIMANNKDLIAAYNLSLM